MKHKYNPRSCNKQYISALDAICSYIEKNGGKIAEKFSPNIFDILAKNEVYLLDEPITVKGLYYLERTIKK